MKCPDCGKNFAKKNALIAHRRWKHQPQMTARKVPYTVHEFTVHPQIDPLAIIRRVKQVASEVGGLNRLGELIAAIDS